MLIPDGCYGAAISRLDELAKEAGDGRDLVAKISAIDSAADQIFATFGGLVVSSSGGYRLDIPLENQKVKDCLLGMLKSERQDLVAKFNYRFGEPRK